MSRTPPLLRAGGRRQRGASPIKLILSLVVLGLIVHTGYVFLPIYIAVYDFTSEIEKEAQFGADKSNDAIVKALIQYGAERKLDIKKENLRVERTQSRLTVSASFTVPVKTLLFTYQWEISEEKSAVLF